MGGLRPTASSPVRLVGLFGAAEQPGEEGKHRGRISEDIRRGLKRLLKKADFALKLAKDIPQGLKPDLYFVRLTARLKSCPDTKLWKQDTESSLFRSMGRVKPSVDSIALAASAAVERRALTILDSSKEFLTKL
jgi:hypothetical protein